MAVQELTFQFRNDPAYSQLLELCLAIFSKIQDQVLLKEASVFSSFHGHASSLCSAALRMLEESTPVGTNPALPSVLLLELLGSSGSMETAQTILELVLFHCPVAPAPSTPNFQGASVPGQLFSHLASSFSKIHSDVRLALVSGIRKLHCMTDPVNQVVVLQVLQDHLQQSSDITLYRAIVTEWRSLIAAWKSASLQLSEPAQHSFTTLITLQVSLLSIASRCSAEVGILGPQVYDLLEALSDVLFALFAQRLLNYDPSHLATVSHQLSLVRSMVVNIFEKSRDLGERGREGLVSFYFDLLLERALDAAPLKAQEVSANQPGDLGEGDVEMWDSGMTPSRPRTPAANVATGKTASPADTVSKTSLLGQNRGRELTNLHKKVTNSIQKKILVHTGRLRIKARSLKDKDSRLLHPLPSPFHEMASVASRNDLVVQNVADLLIFFEIISRRAPVAKEGTSGKTSNTIFVERMRTRLWPAVSFVPLQQYDKILPNRPTFEKYGRLFFFFFFFLKKTHFFI